MSKIEVNAIEPQCGTNLTVGASGDTITFPSGTTIVNNGSQTGFGRTGTVDWQTSIKTTSFTAVSGEGYFVNTTSGAITMTLPASPSVGDIVSVKDYAQTFDTNNLTVGRNSEPIEGQTFDLVLNTEGSAITLIYGDATKGWQSVNSNEVTNAANFVTASGGTETICGDFKIHTFTGPGTFTVTCAGNASGSSSVDYLVVAGGGGGGAAGGGGGAGGYRESSGTASGCYTRSPLGACVSALPVTATGYPITVGGSGTAGSAPNLPGGRGNNSVFSTITSTGGGGGSGHEGASPTAPFPGGSGGGGGGPSVLSGTGNTPPVSPPQGNNGGNGTGSQSPSAIGGGGGGATAVGSSNTNAANPGGAGATSSINGTPTARAGGGGAGATNYPTSAGAGGTGGGGAGGSPNTSPGNAGTANTGGGGGSGGQNSGSATGGAGGSGIVIIRYKFQ
jgi:hypothetical protein